MDPLFCMAFVIFVGLGVTAFVTLFIYTIAFVLKVLWYGFLFACLLTLLIVVYGHVLLMGI